MTTFVWRWNTVFDALRQRNYRWLWLASLASSATYQMGQVAQGWLVYQITGSAWALSWVSSGWSLSALILAPYGGVIADRVEKRQLILIMRGAMVLNMLVLVGLILAGSLQLWHLLASSVLSGIFMSFMMPAQITLVSDLVERKSLLNAMSLNAIGMGLMGILSASGAGLIIESVGIAGVYGTIAGVHLFSFWAISHLPTQPPKTVVQGSVWRDLRAGLGYLGRHTALLLLLGLILVRIVLGMAYITFMPKFAKEAWNMDAAGLGLLMGAPGVGGMLSSLALATLEDFPAKGKLMLMAGILLGFFLCIAMWSPWLVVVFLFLGLAGAMGNICMVTSETLLQSACEEGYRGRIMSVYMMAWGLSPLGTLPAGVLADQFGVPVVVAGEGLLLAAIYWLLGWRRSEVRRLA